MESGQDHYIINVPVNKLNVARVVYDDDLEGDFLLFGVVDIPPLDHRPVPLLQVGETALIVLGRHGVGGQKGSHVPVRTYCYVNSLELLGTHEVI